MKSMHIILLYAVFLIGCANEFDAIKGHYYKKNFSKYSRNIPEQSNLTPETPLQQEAFMDFFDDGTYVMYLNQLEEGKYTVKNDTLNLVSEEGIAWKIHVQESNGLHHLKFLQSGKLVTLNKITNYFKGDYPFTSELNQWRILPQEAMTTNQLIEKFQNHAAFMVAYMRWSHKMGENLSMRNMSSPLQYANNGLMMRRLKNTGNWCEFFFEGDCEKMDLILRNYFDGLIIDWKYTHDRVAMLSDALQQISKGIENHKEYFTE